MKKTLSYTDALRILGGEDGSSLGELGEALTKGTLSELTGVSRWDRTERVAAADLILRITAFFDALAELLEQHHCPFTLRDLRFTRDEQYRLFSDVLRGEWNFKRGMVVSDLFSIDGLKGTHHTAANWQDAAIQGERYFPSALNASG